MVENAGGAWLHDLSDPDALDAFAAEVLDVLSVLRETGAASRDATEFAPPSRDPASLRTKARLATESDADDDAPVPALQSLIDGLQAEVDNATRAATDSRAVDEENADMIRRAGEEFQ